MLLQKQIDCVHCKKRSSCFSELSRSDHKMIEEHRLELKFHKGEIICKQGSFASNIMFIYKGIAKTYLETRKEDQVILNVLPEGKMIGLPALYTERVFPYSASALEECIICSIDIKIFEEYTKSNGAFASELIRTLNQCTISNYDRMISLTHKQLDGRFADALLFLSQQVYKKLSFRNSLSRKDMADLTAMSPESVTRIVNRFISDGIIRVSGKNYEILDQLRLRNISELG